MLGRALKGIIFSGRKGEPRLIKNINAARIQVMKKLQKMAGQLLETKISILTWTGVFLAMIMLRNFIEQFLAKSLPLSPQESLIELIHNLYFFILVIILIWLYLSLVLKINPVRLAYIMSWAAFSMLVPPLIDMAKSGGEIFWSFYLLSGPGDLWKQFLTVFGNLPSGIVYFGTKITFLTAIFACCSLIYLKTGNWIRTIASAVIVYMLLFFMGSFPSLFFYGYAFFVPGKKISGIKSFEIARFLGAPQKIFGLETLNFKYAFAYKLELFYYPFLIFLLAVLFFLMNRKKFMAVLKNFRYPQLIYHGGLFVLGIGLGYLNFRENFVLNIFSLTTILVLLISVALAWKASVVINDIYDLEIDKISNSDRPLPKSIFDISQYVQFGIACFLLSLLGGITIGFNFFLLIFVYQILAWFYSAPPFRLKKFPIIATFVSSLASLMVLFIGYILMSSDQNSHTLSWRIVLLLIICYTISIPIKDLKDIEGDKKYGIWTIPVIFGEKNGRLIIAMAHFCSYVMSVFFLNEFKLFFWAIVFGVINYAIIISKKINPRKVFWWVLGAVFVYLLIMIKIIFVDNLGKFNF
jgi:4-hydroxybenzoate polyprenyltransferase